MNAIDRRIYSESAERHGEVVHRGAHYALLDQANLTNRMFPGWWGAAQAGDEYTSEWSAPAIGEDGEEYVVRWQFDAVRGQEPEDDSCWPWDRISEVMVA